MIVQSQMLSNLFYTTDTYGQFSTDMLDDDWQDESEFDHAGFMKELAELHCEIIERHTGDIVKSIEVVGTYSPREYNFNTDQVELKIDVHIHDLYKYIHKHESDFDAYLREQFTSRDGFWSFIPNNLTDFLKAIDDDSDLHDRCITIMLGWYLTRECLTEQEYLDEMYDRVHEPMWNNFKQFTDETHAAYDKWREKQEKSAVGMQHIPDIEEWYTEVYKKDEK